jgi:hypothetical protein
MSTARLTWVVLDELVPDDDEAAARTALIARDRELASRVAIGRLTPSEAIDELRRRQGRYGPSSAPAPAVRTLAVLVALLLVLGGLSALLLR